MKWKSILAIVAIIVATIMNWNWVWGILFSLWAVNDIILGGTYFVEYVARKEHPVIFWTIITLWLFFALYMFAPGLIDPLWGNPNRLY